MSGQGGGGKGGHTPDFGDYRISERTLARNVCALCVSVCYACAQARIIIYMYWCCVVCARFARVVRLYCFCVRHRG